MILLLLLQHHQVQILVLRRTLFQQMVQMFYRVNLRATDQACQLDHLLDLLALALVYLRQQHH